MSSGAFGAGFAGGEVNLIEILRRPTVISRCCCILFSIVVAASIGSQGWYFNSALKKECCYFNDSASACHFTTFVAVMSILASIGFLVVEYLYANMSAVKIRRRAVVFDIGLSSAWAFLFFVVFCYLASSWAKSDLILAAPVSNIRAIIAFSLFSVVSWAICAFMAYRRWAEGSAAMTSHMMTEDEFESYPTDIAVGGQYGHPHLSVTAADSFNTTDALRY